MSRYRIIYGKACHILFDLEHRAYQDIKQLNFDLEKAKICRSLQLKELEEIQNDAYNCAKHYKDKMKQYHDRHILRKIFSPSQKVLLYNSRLHVFPGKVRTKRTCPFIVRIIYPYGAVDVENLKTDDVFKMNGQRLKPFLEL